MEVAWRPLFSLVLVLALVIHEEWVSAPSCKTVPTHESESTIEDHPEDLKVMMVANLLLLGSDSGYLNRLFTDYYMSKFFRKSFQTLDPDMLVVLGDVSAKGWELTKPKWVSVLHQFDRVVGPFLGLPLHVVLGDRDLGRCGELNRKSVSWVAGRFPGLDSAGCGAFEISNVSFVSLNAVALLCGNDDLRFSVEKVIESESLDLRAEMDRFEEVVDKPGEIGDRVRGFRLRESDVSSGSGPVLLLHFPLRQKPSANLGGSSNVVDDGRGFVGAGPYDLLHNLPANATQYIFQALKPRIVFSGHSHEFSAYTHQDGIYEVAVPAMSWNARDDPGFIFAIFRRNKSPVSIIYCSLARESRVIVAYISVLLLLASIIVLTLIKTHLIRSR
ncbi:Metallo-dependent phosphatase-like [Trema orientale]|uniref:Metallo-dependent phosphatase-like n=1 Tax=Trema orientale TaxID=63057 RepID=A0A2P5G1Z1_TREOI|nr:Metallo-dependent phosphatase-like [Trema orientale]